MRLLFLPMEEKKGEHVARVLSTPLLEIRQANQTTKNEINTERHEILTWKTPPTRRGKNHGRQPAKLHYIGGGYKRRGFTTDQLIPCGGLQEVYITQVT